VARNRRSWGPAMVSSLLLAALTGTAAAIAVQLLPSSLIERLIPARAVPYTRLLVWLAPVEIACIYLVMQLRGRLHISRFGLVTVARPLLVLMGALAFFRISGVSVQAALTGWAAGLGLTLLVCVLLASRSCTWDWRECRLTLLQGAGFARRTYVGSVLGFVRWRLGVLLCAGLAGATCAGLFSVALALVEGILLVSRGVVTVILPRAAKAAQGDQEGLPACIPRTVLAATAVGWCIVILVGKPLVVWAYGPGFAAAAVALAPLTPAVLLSAFSRMYGQQLAGRGHPWALSVSEAAACGVFVLMSILLLPGLGVLGVSLAASAGHLVGALIIALWAGRAVGLRLIDTLPRWDDIATVRAYSRAAMGLRLGGSSGHAS